MVQKYKSEDNKWSYLYRNEFRNRLRRDMNLSDVEDKTEARKNLELCGADNTTHYHDSRYMPLIEALAASSGANLENLKKYIQTLIDTKADIESPGLTGTPTAPTPTKGSSDNQIANTSFVTEADNVVRAEITQMYNRIFDSQGKLTFPNGNKLWIG